jgi:hypothetical protein
VVSPHQFKISGTGGPAGDGCLEATDEYFHIAKGEDYVAVFEFRVKNLGSDNDNINIGLQDVAVGAGSSSTANYIGIVRGSGADWDIRLNDSTGPTDRPAQGTQAAWTKFKFTITCTSTGTPQVEIDVDGASSGTAMTVDMPSTVLRPYVYLDVTNNRTADLRIDYILAYFSGRPLAA